MIKQKRLKMKTIRRISFALCLSLFISIGANYSVHTSADATVESYEDQIAALQAEQERLQAQIDGLSAEETKSMAYKSSLDQLAYTTQQKISLSQTLLTSLTNQIAQTETEIENTETALQDTMNRYLEQVKTTHEDGGASYLELILGSEDIADFLSRIDRINAILEYQSELMSKYEEKVAELEAKKVSLKASQEAEEEAKTTLESDKSTYDALAAQTESYLSSIANDKSELERQYNEVAAQENALNEELESFLRQQQAKSETPAFTPSSGFIRPVAAGTGYISCSFGEPDLIGVPHRGTDIACATGTPLMASASGTVLRAEWHSSYGYYVLIDHGNGVAVLYAHCSQLLTYAGATVNQGDVVALVGATGFVSGPHVHIEYRINGSLANPAAYMNLY